jgi:hypothetical protein
VEAHNLGTAQVPSPHNALYAARTSHARDSCDSFRPSCPSHPIILRVLMNLLPKHLRMSPFRCCSSTRSPAASTALISKYNFSFSSPLVLPLLPLSCPLVVCYPILPCLDLILRASLHLPFLIQVSERAIYVLNNDVILRFVTNNRQLLVPILSRALQSNTFAQAQVMLSCVLSRTGPLFFPQA